MNGNGGPVAGTAAVMSAAAKRTDLTAIVPRTTDGIVHVIGDAIYVVAGSGRARWSITYRCPFDGDRHLSHTRGDLPPVMQRKAACCTEPVLIHPAART